MKVSQLDGCRFVANDHRNLLCVCTLDREELIELQQNALLRVVHVDGVNLDAAFAIERGTG